MNFSISNISSSEGKVYFDLHILSPNKSQREKVVRIVVDLGLGNPRQIENGSGNSKSLVCGPQSIQNTKPGIHTNLSVCSETIDVKPWLFHLLMNRDIRNAFIPNSTFSWPAPRIIESRRLETSNRHLQIEEIPSVEEESSSDPLSHSSLKELGRLVSTATLPILEIPKTDQVSIANNTKSPESQFKFPFQFVNVLSQSQSQNQLVEEKPKPETERKKDELLNRIPIWVDVPSAEPSSNQAVMIKIQEWSEADWAKLQLPLIPKMELYLLDEARTEEERATPSWSLKQFDLKSAVHDVVSYINWRIQNSRYVFKENRLILLFDQQECAMSKLDNFRIRCLSHRIAVYMQNKINFGGNSQSNLGFENPTWFVRICKALVNAGFVSSYKFQADSVTNKLLHQVAIVIPN